METVIDCFVAYPTDLSGNDLNGLEALSQLINCILAADDVN